MPAAGRRKFGALPRSRAHEDRAGGGVEGLRQSRGCGMTLFWRRKLPTGDALEKEAERLGVSTHEIYKGEYFHFTVLGAWLHWRM
jgi:hypothetical protein